MALFIEDRLIDELRPPCEVFLCRGAGFHVVPANLDITISPTL
jgi:hypothetical protein